MSAASSRGRTPAVAGRVARWRFGDDAGEVGAALARGAVLAVPTESSYGLAVDPRDAEGVARIFRLKGRPGTKALPVVGATAAAFGALGVAPDDPGLAWAVSRWPAALAVVVALRKPIPASAGGRSLAVRVPGDGRLLALLAALRHPLTATSANPSGEAAYTDPEDLAAWLTAKAAGVGIEVLVVDGGRLPGGAPSTLVEIVDGKPIVLRPGRIALD